MLFGKRRNAGDRGGDARLGNERQQLYRIDFDMMLKGSVYKRRSGEVRQFGVTVDGATRLVTSGDIVDKATYDALVAVGAIRDTRQRNEAPAAQPGAVAKFTPPKTSGQRPQQEPSADLPPSRKKGEREQAI